MKIGKGELRFGTQLEIGGHQSWSYKHWFVHSLTGSGISERLNRGCTSPKQIQNLKESIEDNIEYLDGFDELSPDLQAKVSRALEQGHVDDSDWRGVIASYI